MDHLSVNLITSINQAVLSLRLKMDPQSSPCQSMRATSCLETGLILDELVLPVSKRAHSLARPVAARGKAENPGFRYNEIIEHLVRASLFHPGLMIPRDGLE